MWREPAATRAAQCAYCVCDALTVTQMHQCDQKVQGTRLAGLEARIGDHGALIMPPAPIRLNLPSSGRCCCMLAECAATSPTHPLPLNSFHLPAQRTTAAGTGSAFQRRAAAPAGWA